MCYKCWFKKKKTAEVVRELSLTEKLNTKFGDLFEYILYEYNSRHTFQLAEADGKYDLSRFIAPKFDEGGFTDARDSGKGAFSLKPPVSIQAKQPEPATHKGVYRLALSYEYTIRALENPDVKAFEILIRAALDDFAKKHQLDTDDRTIGNARFRLKLASPSSITEYFLELNNSAGFELRIWTDCVNLSKV